MRAVRLSHLLFLSVTCVALSSSALAQAGDPSAADALFESARQAMARGEIATACARFAESMRLDPAPGTLLNVAQCEEKQGKLATSYAHLNEVLESLPKDDFRISYVREQLAALKPRVPTVTVTLAKESAGARVLRDDVELRDGSFGVPLPVDPGPHVFIVRAEGRSDARQELTLREGQHETLSLNQGSALPNTNTKTPSVSPQVGARDASGGKRALAIGAFAVGGAGLLTGIVTGIMFADAASTYRGHCDASGCDDDGLSAAARGKTLNVVSPVALGVGALGLGLGTYFLLTSKSPPARQGRLDVHPLVSTQGTGLVMTGGF